MKKKYYIVLIIIISVIIAASISIKVGTDLLKESKIKEEVKEIINYFEKGLYNDDELNKILNREVIESGYYNIVEKSVKTYYSDLKDDLSNLDFLLSDDNYSNYLNTSNLKEDRPNFVKSKDNLHNTKSQIEEVYKELDNQINDKNIKMSYINDKKLKTYYKDLYLSLINDYISEEFTKNISNIKEKSIEKITIYDEVFDFLIANKAYWSIEKELIVFKENIYYEEYLNIIKRLEEVSTN
ncbi:MAG: hypothetical protein ACI4XM_08450 [Candidatus Coprovivens sp.]